MKRVVVTGIGMINSLGLEKESAFKAIVDGQCGIKTIESFDAEKFSVRIAGEITDFDPTSVMDKKEIKKADRFIQLGLKASADAIADANLPDDVDKDRFGVSSASGIGGLPNIAKNSVICENRGPRRISPFFIPSSLVNMLGGFVSIYQNLKMQVGWCMPLLVHLLGWPIQGQPNKLLPVLIPYVGSVPPPRHVTRSSIPC